MGIGVLKCGSMRSAFVRTPSQLPLRTAYGRSQVSAIAKWWIQVMNADAFFSKVRGF
jgi:hypothetical protein